MSCFCSMTSFVRSLCYISLNLPILFATEFLPSIIIGKVVERDQRNILVRYHFDTMFRFRPTTSFEGQSALITLILPLHCLPERLILIFTKYLQGVKLFNVIRETFWKNIFLIICFIFDVLRHLLMSFCSILLIQPIHRLFEQLKIIFRKFLLW